MLRIAYSLICINISSVLPLEGPSVPSVAIQPASAISGIRATPLAAFALLPGQFTILTSFSARRMMSSSDARRRCAAMRFDESSPSSSIQAIGDME